MFTGLIEKMGQVARIVPGRGSSRLTISGAWPAEEITPGESIAVNGVCLTAVAATGDRFEADVVSETLKRTRFGQVRPGEPVNLERSLRASDRLGGHLVSGHVDATVRLRQLTRRGDDWRLKVELPAELARFVALKGSVALHGVSLTVAGVDRDSFEVALVPETLARTTLGAARAGDRLHLEVDLVSRYLERLLQHPHGGGKS